MHDGMKGLGLVTICYSTSSSSPITDLKDLVKQTQYFPQDKVHRAVYYVHSSVPFWYKTSFRGNISGKMLNHLTQFAKNR